MRPASAQGSAGTAKSSSRQCDSSHYFFWGGQSKRKSEVSNWEKIFAKVIAKAAEIFPKLFIETSGEFMRLPRPGKGTKQTSTFSWNHRCQLSQSLRLHFLS
jgi:hypothetical protein